MTIELSPLTLFLFALALGLTALYLYLREDEEHRDARERNPRTWDDE